MNRLSRLTDALAATCRPESKEYAVRDNALRGFALRVQPSAPRLGCCALPILESRDVFAVGMRAPCRPTRPAPGRMRFWPMVGRLNPFPLPDLPSRSSRSSTVPAAEATGDPAPGASTRATRAHSSYLPSAANNSRRLPVPTSHAGSIAIARRVPAAPIVHCLSSRTCSTARRTGVFYPIRTSIPAGESDSTAGLPADVCSIKRPSQHSAWPWSGTGCVIPMPWRRYA